MKRIKKGFIIASSLLMVALCTPSVFAEAPYGMEYSGGEPLGTNGNVNIAPDLIDSLVPMIKKGSITTEALPTSEWESGYFKLSPDACVEGYYFLVDADSDGGSDSAGNRGFVISDGEYSIGVGIIEVVTNNVQFEGRKYVAVGVRPHSNYLYVGMNIFSDATCETRRDDVVKLSYASDGEIYVRTNAKLTKEGTYGRSYSSNNMYFGITDIDAAQSYMITNSDFGFAPSNMFAASAEDLQPGPDDLKNIFVPAEGGSKSYIYSEHTTESVVDSSEKANIFTKLTRGVLSDGVQIVFGFHHQAASGINFYTQKYNVIYEADENGEITGITNEKVMPGENPSNTTYEAKEGYKFSHWITDVDVYFKEEETSTDYTTITAGTPFPSELIEKIEVDSDIKFTAIFEKIEEEKEEEKEDTPAVPNTGMNTGNTNATVVSISVIGITLGALFIKLLPRFTHKKVNFKK